MDRNKTYMSLFETNSNPTALFDGHGDDCCCSICIRRFCHRDFVRKGSGQLLCIGSSGANLSDFGKPRQSLADHGISIFQMK